MVKYYEDPDTCRLVSIIVNVLRDYFSYIDIERVKCYRSRGSRSGALARIHGLPRIWLIALGIKPMYIIEVLEENYSGLSLDEKVRVVIHELLHIPKKFSGGLRPHGKYVNKRIVNKLFRLFVERGGLELLEK